MDFAPGLSKLQDYVIEKNPNEPDPFIIRRVGIPHWLGGYEALDGIFVHTIGKSGNTPAVRFLIFDDQKAAAIKTIEI